MAYWIIVLSQQAFYILQHNNQTISSHVKHFTGNLNINFKFTEILEHWAIFPHRNTSQRLTSCDPLSEMRVPVVLTSRITNEVTLKSVEPVLHAIQISLLHVA
jgi:hypothetical protein